MKLDHFNIVVSDMARSVAFYREVLGFNPTFETHLEGAWIEQVTGLEKVRAHCVFLQIPDCDVRLELLQYLEPHGIFVEGNAWPNTMGLRHFALETDDIDALVVKLKAAQIAFVSPPVTVPFAVGSRGTKRLCYFHDPDGVLLEIASYEAAI